VKIPTYSVSLVRERTVTYPAARDSSEASRVLHAMLDNAPAERVVALYLDGRSRVIGAEVVAMGGLHGVSVGPREVLRGAILAGASAVILGHNHPSGDPTPSTEDIEFTATMCAAGLVVDILIVDHVIVTPDGKHASMFELDLMRKTVKSS